MEIKTVGQLIQHLATKAGVDAADPNLVNILSNAELSKVPIHSDLVTGIDNNLLSLTAAGDNHPVLKSKYHAQAMNAFDKKMEDVMTEAGLSDDKVAELKAEKSTYKRFEALSAAIKEAAEAKGKSTSGEDKSELQKQVDKLLQDLKDTKKSNDQALKVEQEARRGDRIGFELKAMLGTVKTVFDDMPAEAKTAALNSLVNKALQDKGASFDFDESGLFILKGKDDTAVIGANSTKYTPQTFIDEVLAQNKVLKVSEQQNSDTTPPPAGGGRTTTIVASDATLKGNNQTANLNRRNREAATANFQSKA